MHIETIEHTDNVYVLVSPVRDESMNIVKTLDSVVNQTIKPSLWIIVNDGSTDNTVDIVKRYMKKYPWIKLIDLPDRGFRLPGKGIMDAFYKGFDSIGDIAWDFVVKLDCDLSFDFDYFENIFKEFIKNPKLGLASGKTYLPVNGDVGNLKLEWCPDTCTRGPCKVYSKKFFEKTGGPLRERGWDTLDDIAALLAGMDSRSFSEYKIIHYRPIGTLTNTHKGVKSRIQMGQNFYYIGYHPLFVLLKTIKMFFTDKPVFVAGLFFCFGYFKSFFASEPQISDKRLVKKLKEMQLKRIFRCIK